ncbi:TonB-dependent receptor plug domain-containing protein [Chryseobacterium salviniae]|uniref:TonB-dependent receptor plug domain-containing protein n=1 Tax=Chryseobacterium salviniae TaxID=3101750 RepID=A0ABU6HRB9_9FLAO|nr:TonB-dependent receptor plug domain-containing protein [Chryseobacterium sp. T9W2-O]MEC3875596.1 TonB-dependent receptor plug domain-containing protein [Chryseobacterium sp. T9W2-O]
MNFKVTTSILGLFFLAFASLSKAQESFKNFEKEKTYIQTNHVFYKPGEEMYFKIYTVKAENNLPADQSKAVNFELVDPGGSVVKKAKYEIINGYSEGYFYFNSEMKGGIYKLRAFTNWMKNEDGKNAFEKEITLQKIVSPRILMKLEFPKKGYGAGDEVLANFSMRSLSNLPIPFYEGDYTVMHNGEKISEGKLITDKEGKNQLKFRLPAVLKSSDALLTIKINFDGFTESISRNIPIVLNNLDVKFMPEGGTLVNGIEQNIAFKILDAYEKPVDAILEIFNRNHQKVAETAAYNFGMGNFYFTPKRGENYYAKVLRPENISAVYQFPAAKDEGIIFNVNKQNRKIYFKIISTQEKEITLRGSFREKEIYHKIIPVKNEITQLEIPENDLPAGICRFTVYEDNIPLAERIIFTNENRQVNIKVKPVKQNYLPREKVVLHIETTDENNRPVPANVALSVVDDKLWTYADDKQNHIISWLLLDSELKGKIERPQFYFDKKEDKRIKSLDLVMLTNGYRYFEMIPEVIQKKKYKYLPEKKNPVYGIVEDENGNPVKADVFLVRDSIILKQATSEDGLFYFSDLSRKYSQKLIAKSHRPKQQVKIRILSYKLPVNPLDKKTIHHVDVEEIVKETLKEEKTLSEGEAEKLKISTENKTHSTSDTVKLQKIEEVVMLGYSQTLAKKYSTVASNIVENNEFGTPELSSILSGKAAGIVVSPSGQPGGYINVQIRGNTSLANRTPLYIVDGVPVENFKTKINPNDINSMTVLKDAAATSIYGNRAANGVIIINSYKNNRSNIKFDVTPKSYYAVLNVPGDSLASYNYTRRFSYPVYTTTHTAYRYDYRETLYWNPVVETGKDGKAQVEFYNSDANSAFRIMTEGISSSGLVGRNETTYAAQSLISIDAKLPQYVTRTDEMIIPVVVKNNSPETRKMSMDVIVPNRVSLVESDSTITLKPLESGKLFVKIRTNEVIASNIQFTIRSGDFRETMILPFKVEEKGFPHHYSIINNKTEDNSINISDFIDGSFYSSYYVYENSALQMFEDIERLKKEPHGCFEQLSSTVYPNIFVLDYLRQSKKITPETEAQVIRNLRKGFQKMLSYKNRDGGFSYFGSSESDVALSAFALLEFKDLKKYINIEPKIIQDLTAFIISKKNQNGIFEVKRNYERNDVFSDFAWSRNMYVLYALSKTGIRNLDDAYEISLKRALAAKDSYQLALMANIAANLDKNDEHQKLIEILNKQFNERNIKTKITFTGSGGFSANSETIALYLMALQKDKNANMLKLTEIADELINSNGYYGFGSTQATTLALEALSKFFAENEKLYGTEKPFITINNAEVKANNSLVSAYKTGKNLISINYPSGKGLPYKLDYGYYTLKAPENAEIPVTITTSLKSETAKTGDTNRMTVAVSNIINNELPMVTAKIGIPAGLTLQNALLKDLLDKKQFSYFEIFDNYLVLYWEHFNANETKTINLDLKVEFAGEYTGKASNVYLYYTPEKKHWNEGVKAKIQP